MSCKKMMPKGRRTVFCKVGRRGCEHFLAFLLIIARINARSSRGKPQEDLSALNGLDGGQ
jgi:hypothetical protein